MSGTSGTGPPGADGERKGTARSDGWRWGAGAAVMALLATVALCRGEAGPGAPGSADSGAPAPAPTVRLERGWPVMGTVLRVSAAAPDSGTAREALEAARSAVFRVDSLMSTYRDDSDLSRVNAAAGSGRWIPVAPATARVLEAALSWAAASGGAFDPTAGPLADAWGFHAGDPARPPPGRADSAARLVGWRLVEHDSAGRRVRLPREGMRLDFGAIAKGWALDRAKAAMRDAGAAAGTVDLGGNVSVFGPPPGDRDRWGLGIRHPRREGRLAGTVAVDSGSVATSGDSEQYFVADGVRWSHVMDPRTGRPARGVVQVTVIADRGIDADALSTALFVLGPEEGRALLESPAVRRRAPRATAAWILDPGPGRSPGPGEVACAGPRAESVELWIGWSEGDTLPAGCRGAAPSGLPGRPGGGPR